MATINQSDNSSYRTQVSQLLTALSNQRVKLANNLRQKGIAAYDSEIFNTLIPKVLKISATLGGVLIQNNEIVDSVQYTTLNPTSTSDTATLSFSTFTPFRLIILYEKDGQNFVAGSYHLDNNTSGTVGIRTLKDRVITGGNASKDVLGVTVTVNTDNVVIGFTSDSADSGYWMHPDGHYHLCLCSEESYNIMSKGASLIGLNSVS